MLHAALDGHLLQEGGELGGIEVIGVAELRAEIGFAGAARGEVSAHDINGRREAAHVRHARMRCGAFAVKRDEIVGELPSVYWIRSVQNIEKLNGLPMIIVIPIDEVRRDFEGGIRAFKELGFGNAELMQQNDHARQTRLADADDWNVGRLHQGDLEVLFAIL